MTRFQFRMMAISHRVRSEIQPGLPHPFPPHDPDYPDVDPETGDERETTDP